MPNNNSVKLRRINMVLMMVVGTIIYCISVVWILDLGEFYAGGVTGISQLISKILARFGINISKSVFIALINNTIYNLKQCACIPNIFLIPSF